MRCVQFTYQTAVRRLDVSHRWRWPAGILKGPYSGGATPGRAGSNDLAGRSTALAQALHIALLR